MSRFLPPLNALRAFESAGRHLSFTKAAAELNVTQAAVSHQIKALEERLGLTLFKRQNRRLLLTDAGQAYLPSVRDTFEGLARATERLLARDRGGALTASVLPSFAAKWLVPRLGRFREAHPEIDVRLSTDLSLSDFNRADVDVAIRYGQGGYPGLESVRLMTEELFPVCSPALLRGDKPLRKPSDLQFHTLLHDDFQVDWRLWLLAAGVKGVDPARGPTFTDSSMVIQAAVEGQGVALARSVLSASDLAAGRLVKPFEVSMPASWAYYLVYPPATRDSPKIAAFRNWLLVEAKATANAALALAKPVSPPP
jgi:LysR family transcriptional regulator, glycine cleavage system transcriptional activator